MQCYLVQFNNSFCESLIFGMVQSGLSPCESIWVIHMHHCIQHPSSESKYRQIKPNLKKLWVQSVLMLNQNSLLLIILELRTKEILNQTRTNFARKQKKNTVAFLSYNNTVSMS